LPHHGGELRGGHGVFIRPEGGKRKPESGTIGSGSVAVATDLPGGERPPTTTATLEGLACGGGFGKVGG
jgi:hypothetical protein